MLLLRSNADPKIHNVFRQTGAWKIRLRCVLNLSHKVQSCIPWRPRWLIVVTSCKRSGFKHACILSSGVFWAQAVSNRFSSLFQQCRKHWRYQGDYLTTDKSRFLFETEIGISLCEVTRFLQRMTAGVGQGGCNHICIKPFRLTVWKYITQFNYRKKLVLHISCSVTVIIFLARNKWKRASKRIM